jgi:RHS repeat-associated protein
MKIIQNFWLESRLGTKIKNDKRIVDDGTTVTTTIYVAGMEIEIEGSTETQRTVYYGAGGAFRIIGGSDAGLYYRHTDHLGSTSVVSDSTGAKLAGSEVVFAPFGEVRAGSQSTLTDFGYTGQRVDASTDGLMYYGARYYLPQLRRFISADSIVPGAGNPQAFNRYSYALNSPISFIDPTGHYSCPADMSSSECAAMTRPVTAHNPNEKVHTTTQSTAPNHLKSMSQAHLAAADAQDKVVAPTNRGGSSSGSGGGNGNADRQKPKSPLPDVRVSDLELTCGFEATTCGGDVDYHRGLDITNRSSKFQAMLGGFMRGGDSWAAWTYGRSVLIETPFKCPYQLPQLPQQISQF